MSLADPTATPAAESSPESTPAAETPKPGVLDNVRRLFSQIKIFPPAGTGARPAPPRTLTVVVAPWSGGRGRGSLHGVRMGPASRRRQVQELRHAREHDPAWVQLTRWVDQQEAKNPGLRVAACVETGTYLLNLSAEEEAALQREVPEARASVSGPVQLLHPRATLGRAGASGDEDLSWHLRTIQKHGSGDGATGAGVTVALLDSGVDATHPSLRGKVRPAEGFAPREPAAALDPHGTHVAGLLCGEGIGVAPGVTVVDVPMLPGGRGSDADFINALGWVIPREEISLVNLSAGLRGWDPTLQAQVDTLVEAGVLPIAAVGNEGRNRTRSPGNYVGVLSVGACNRDGRVAAFSSCGTILAGDHQRMVPDLVAPGEAVWSCVPGGEHEVLDGTSMATPLVTGAAARILERHPDIDLLDLVDALLQGCRSLEQDHARQGAGLLQV